MKLKEGDKVMFIGPHNRLTKEDHLVLMKVYTIITTVSVGLNAYALVIGASAYYQCPDLFALVEEES